VPPDARHWPRPSLLAIIRSIVRYGSFLCRLGAYQAALSLLALPYWQREAFGDVSVDQVLWHVLYADRAALHMSELFVVECLVTVVATPMLLALGCTAAHFWLAPRLAGWWLRVLRFAPAAVGTVGAMVLAMQLSVFSYAAAFFGPDLFAKDYVDPHRVNLTAQKQLRNLILVYVESLEATYEDADLFGRDLLAPLDHLGGRSYSYRPIAGMNWTISGIVSTQCAVPLQFYFDADLRSRGAHKAFLPGATCLGDVLEAHGYANVFLGGAPLSFAGKGKFFRDHGYTERWGRDEWKAGGSRPGEMHGWGLHDAALFAHARSKLDQLHASGQPFNLTLLTVDTHHPRGLMTAPCSNRGGSDFEGILACSVREVADFVQYAKDRGYLRDTAVVVVGDHLAVANPLMSKLEQAGSGRRIFNLFLADDMPPANSSEMLSFDLFPTVLDIVGIQVSGGRLGLGYSVVGAPGAVRPDGWAEHWSVASVRGSRRYEQLWRTERLQPAELGD
jgi:phosphoglycerol transferase